MVSLRGFRREFRTHRNRELFSQNSEPWGENREFYWPGLKLLPDTIFGIKGARQVSPCPHKQTLIGRSHVSAKSQKRTP
jgi:hypothetical protein